MSCWFEFCAERLSDVAVRVLRVCTRKVGGRGGPMYAVTLTERHTDSGAQAAAAGKLVVIADFDRTITRCFVDGAARGTSAHVLSTCTTHL